MKDPKRVLLLGAGGMAYHACNPCECLATWTSPAGNPTSSCDGTVTEFDCVVRIDTPVELQYYRNGGILQFVLRNMLKS